MDVKTASGRKITPTGNNILVKALYRHETESGIIIPETSDAANYTQTGEIFVFGEDAKLENCKLGDRVYFIRGIGEYTRQRYKIDGVEYYIFEDIKVLARVGENLEACNDMTICKYPKLEKETKSGLILPDKQKDTRQAWIATIESTTQKLKPGDRIVVDFFYTFTHKNENYIAIPEENVLAVLK